MGELVPPWQVGKVGNRKNPAAQKHKLHNLDNPERRARRARAPALGLLCPWETFWDGMTPRARARGGMADGYEGTGVLYSARRTWVVWLLYSVLRRLDAGRLARAT